MLEHDALAHWLEGAQLGAEVETPTTAGSGPLGLTSRPVVDAQLPAGLVRPWVVYASQLEIVGGGDFAALAAGTSPSYLSFGWGMGNVRIRSAVDLPVTGGIWQLPPTAAVEVVAQLQPLAAGAAAVGRWQITAAPGQLGYATFPTLTPPLKTAPALGVSSVKFGRPAHAIGYRVLVTNADSSASNIQATQVNNGSATLLSMDAQVARLYGATTINKRDWFPLHPCTTEVLVFSFYAAATPLTVQWVLQIG